MLGLINFTHSLPLYLAYPGKEDVFLGTPSQNMEMILGGKIKCGMVSLLEYLHNSDSLEMVPGAVIRSNRTTMSTLLVSRAEVSMEHMRIAVTAHTKTTQFYLENILKKQGYSYSIVRSTKTEAIDLLEEAEYALVIGDEALKVFSTGIRIIWDVGYEFNRLTSLPPLFAVSVKRRNANCTEELNNLQEAMVRSSNFRTEASRISAERLGISVDIMMQYYSVIRYDMSADAIKTLEYVESAV